MLRGAKTSSVDRAKNGPSRIGGRYRIERDGLTVDFWKKRAGAAFHQLVEMIGRGEKIDSDRLGSILTLKGAFGVQNACAFCDSRARLGSIFRPLLPKDNATPVCNQELTEYHELKHSRKMFLDNV